MALESVLTIEKARDRGHQVWKAIFTNWGNVGASADAGGLSIAYLLKKQPISGAQIAPESDIGEVELEFNAGQRVPQFPPVGDANMGDRAENAIYLRRGQPYMWRTQGDITINATFSSIWGDVYFPTTPPAATPLVGGTFGGALDADRIRIPTLVLELYLDVNPPIVAAPNQPFSERAAATRLVIDDEDEHLCYFYPVQHRKRMRLDFSNYSAADILDVRVTGLMGGTTRTGLPSYGLKEFPLQAKVVNANTREMFHIVEPDCAWIGIYAKKQANTGESNVGWNLYAD